MRVMASSSLNNRKKLDEYHLKILRELLTLPANKYCFDCHQRGPTYVNVTIGSFVCTTCSGMLRGLTPPHRVKSVTMATFSPEEVEFVKARGNEYCRKVWLGLHDSEVPTKDEQQIKEFMISKYEKKRYYLDPSSTIVTTNGCRTPSSLSSCSSSSHTSPSSHNMSDTSSGKNVLQAHQSKRNMPSNTGANSTTGNNLFTADFVSPSSSDFFSSSLDSSLSSETSFANFDNNPVFSTTSNNATAWYIDSVNDTFPKIGILKPMVIGSNMANRPMSLSLSNINSGKETNAKSKETPAEDKYAALKDLDCLMKSELQEKHRQQSTNLVHNTGVPNSLEWSNGPLWSNVFPNSTNGTVSEPATPFNPFAGNTNSWLQQKSFDANPFSPAKQGMWNGSTDAWKTSNGLNGQSVVFNGVSNNWGTNIAGNPFKVSNWSQPNGHHQSSNPFL